MQVLPPQPFPAPTKQEDGFDMRRFLGVVQRRALVIIGIAAFGIPFSVTSALNETTTYESGFQLLVEPVNAENALSSLTTEGSSPQRSSLDYATQIAVLKSPELLAEVVEELQTSYPDMNYGTIAGPLSVNRVGETKILQIGYQGDDPAKVQAILDQLSETYLQYSLNERQTYLRQGIQFVDEQLPVLQDKVDSLQDELQAFRQTNRFIDPDQQAERVSSQEATLDQQRADVEQALSAARSTLSTLQQDDGALAALNQSQGYQQLLSQVRQIESEIAVERTRFRAGNINIQVLERKKANIIDLLEQEAARALDASLAETVTQIQTLEIQQQEISAAQARVQQQFQALPVLSREYANLQRELEIATSSLTRFLETRQELQVQAAQQEIPWQVIQEPAQPYPLPNDTNRGLMMGILGSFALGIGAALLLEKLDNTFHSADDLRDKLQLPILGVLPFDVQLAASGGDENSEGRQRRRQRKKSFARMARQVLRSTRKWSKSKRFLPLSLALDDYESHSRFMEALRVLHANFQMLSSADRPLRSIVVSSAMPGDGKSTVALQWAKAAVAMGQSVLLVDADLRLPQIHAQLNFPNESGLSNLIVENIDFDSVIQQVQPGEELYVITAGRTPPDPASLLSSQRTRQLIEKANNLFDLVIYDTPPLLGLADASLLARHADGLVLVVGLDKTDCSVLQKVLNDLKSFQTPVLGLIANGQKGYDSSVREYALPPDAVDASFTSV